MVSSVQLNLELCLLTKFSNDPCPDGACPIKTSYPIVDRSRAQVSTLQELLRFGLIAEDEQTKKDGWQSLMQVPLWNETAQMEAFKLLDCTKNFTAKVFAEYINRIEIWAAQDLGVCLESINTTLRNNALNIK